MTERPACWLGFVAAAEELGARCWMCDAHSTSGIDLCPFTGSLIHKILVVGLEEGQSDDGPDDAGEFVERSSVAAGEVFPVLEV